MRGYSTTNIFIMSKMTFPHITLADKEDSTYYVHLSHFKRLLHLKIQQLQYVSAGLEKAESETRQASTQYKHTASTDNKAPFCLLKNSTNKCFHS